MGYRLGTKSEAAKMNLVCWPVAVQVRSFTPRSNARASVANLDTERLHRPSGNAVILWRTELLAIALL